MGLWDNPQGWGGEGGGRGVQDGGTHVYPWLIHIDVWQKPPQYCKVIRFQLKKKKEQAGFCKMTVTTSMSPCGVGMAQEHTFTTLEWESAK